MTTTPHNLSLRQGFTELFNGRIVADYGNEQMEIPLSDTALMAVFDALGVQIDRESVTMLDDDELAEKFELNPDWISVDTAAERLGVNKRRIYALVKGGRLTARNDMGHKMMISAADVQARVDNPPKPGRPW